MSFLRTFLAVWKLTRALKYTPEAEARDFWTRDDERWLDSQFKTYSGQKLKMRLDNYVINAAHVAVLQKPHGQYAYDSGEAHGIALGVGAIYSHLPQISPASAHDASELDENEDTLAQLEPLVS